MIITQMIKKKGVENMKAETLSIQLEFCIKNKTIKTKSNNIPRSTTILQYALICQKIMAEDTTDGIYYTYEILDSKLNRLGIVSTSDCYFHGINSDTTIEELKNSGIRKLQFIASPVKTAREFLKEEKEFIDEVKRIDRVLESAYKKDM